MRIGYARVSTEDQRLDRQVDALERAGCERVFVEKASGMKDARPELGRMLGMVREGDDVVVAKLDRISRSTKHLIELSETFDRMGVNFVSLGDSIDTTTPMGRFFFRVMASIAELERDMIAERTSASICGIAPSASATLATAPRAGRARSLGLSGCTSRARSP
jgi:DNA invertase Pin-like site-specific DNA recombinase